MGDRFEQFLGSTPGTTVESPVETGASYSLTASDGFEFFISFEDFRNYYRKVGEPTPDCWSAFVTDAANGFVEVEKAARVVEIIRSLERAAHGWEAAREIARVFAACALEGAPPEESRIGELCESCGINRPDMDEARVIGALPREILELLAGNGFEIETLFPACAPPPMPESPFEGIERPVSKAKTTRGLKPRMKNVDLTIDGDMLVMKVDLAKEFGPSKSGKNIIVASSEGNKGIPGRIEKLGLNVYKTPGQKPQKGHRDTFKNVEMRVEGDELTILIDLTKEFGPSKSGKTIIVASTEGNQLVYNREEKIGLNVYKKLEDA